AAVAIAKHLLCDLFRSLRFVTALPGLDEVGILGETAGVEVERDAMLPANCADRFHIFHRDRLASAGVVGNRQHDQGHMLAAYALDEGLEGLDVHVPFEGMLQAGLAAFRNNQVASLSADELHVGAGSIEMGVVRDYIAFLAHHAKQNALGGAALVGGNDVRVAENILDRIAKPLEAAAAGVA